MKVAEVARPFEVLEEAMQARAGVIAMHGEVLELALAETGEDIERALVAMVTLESGVSRNLQRVAAAYPTNTFAAAMDAFAERRHVREATVALIRSGRQAEAIENLKQRGAPAEERLERELIALISGIRTEAIAARDAADREQYQAKLRLVGTLIGLGILGLMMSNLITRSISRPLDVLRGRMAALANGDLSVEVPFRDEETELGAMARAVEVLKDSSAHLEGQRWLNAHVARISGALPAAVSPSELGRIALEGLAEVVGAHVAIFYAWDEAQQLFLPCAGYGVQWDSARPVSFRMGEGAVGQTALGRKTVILSDLPDAAPRIVSGACEMLPRSLLLAPVTSSSGVLGVVELGSLHSMGAREVELLEILGPLLALHLEILDRSLRTQALLLRTQQQAEELQASEEELRSQSEQLQAANEELRASEEELKTQREELQATNEELEEKGRAQQEQAKLLERARLEAEQRALERDTANRYKSEFLANMSHELRTPLNSLLILARSLVENEEGNLTDEQIDSARIIQESGSDLLRLINDILDLSKIEAGKMDLVASDFRLADFAEALRRRFVPLAEAKNLHLGLVIGEDAPISIRSDSGKLTQILNNLLANAIKFTDAGRVTLRVERSRTSDVLAEAGLESVEALAISVSDTGIGIPPSELERIFVAFEQVDGTTSRRFGGSGLGLAISRKLARLLGGDIVVSSAEGQGSVFTLTVPLVAPNETHVAPFAPPAEMDPIQAPLPFESAKFEAEDDRDRIAAQDEILLIVEDDLPFARIIRELARKRGFKCILADDGPSGIELARRYRPTAVVLDIGLPGMDGWQVKKALADSPDTSQIPVHFMSASDLGARALEAGAIGFLNKPVTREQIDGALDAFRKLAPKLGRKLLLVEDDSASRASVRRLLKDWTTEIVEVTTGADALSMLRGGDQFACVILDLGLPDIGGQALLDQCAREGLILPPVVTYTARDLSDEETIALREHTDSIVIKGAHAPERLIQEVTLFLNGVRDRLPDMRKGALAGDAMLDGRLAGRTVLVVDDDMRNAFALSRMLRSRGMKVLMAQDGQKALTQLAESAAIEIVLMDIMMPGMDGYQTIGEIRRQDRFKGLPIVALTAKAMPGDREKCLAAQANAYLPKPIDVDALLTLMRDLLIES